MAKQHKKKRKEQTPTQAEISERPVQNYDDVSLFTTPGVVITTLMKIFLDFID